MAKPGNTSVSDKVKLRTCDFCGEVDMSAKRVKYVSNTGKARMANMCSKCISS